MAQTTTTTDQYLEKLDQKLDRLIEVVATREALGQIEARMTDVDGRISHVLKEMI